MDKRSKRVVIWSWSASGAVTRLVTRFALQIRASRPDVDLCCFLHGSNAAIPTLEAAGIRIEVIEGVASFRTLGAIASSGFHRIKRFREVFDKLEPSTILIPMNFGLAWPLASLAARRGHHVIYVCHEHEPNVGDFAPAMQRFTQGRLFRGARHVLFVSEFVRDYVVRRQPELAAKSSVMPLLDLGWRLPAVPRTRSERLRLLFVGRFVVYKGLDRLIGALSRLKDRDDFTLTLAGDGPERGRFEPLFAADRRIDTSCIGYVSEAKLDELLTGHDLLVCPYLGASQSGVICEAAYADLPALVTPVGALAEQVGHGKLGLVAEDSGEAAIAAGIAALLDDPGRLAVYRSEIQAAVADGPGRADVSWLDR